MAALYAVYWNITLEWVDQVTLDIESLNKVTGCLGSSGRFINILGEGTKTLPREITKKNIKNVFLFFSNKLFEIKKTF